MSVIREIVEINHYLTKELYIRIELKTSRYGYLSEIILNKSDINQ